MVKLCDNRADQQVMAIDSKEDQNRQDELELADNRNAAGGRGIEHLHDRKTNLESDYLASELDRHEKDHGRKPYEQAGQYFFCRETDYRNQAAIESQAAGRHDRHQHQSQRGDQTNLDQNRNIAMAEEGRN